MASDTLEAFLSLGLDNISDDWVCQLWSDNFCESSPLSVDDHDALFNEANWQSVVFSATGWLDSSNAEAQGCQLWEVLAGGNIAYKTIIAVIFSIVDKIKENYTDTCLATLAANLYLLLLQIPGSGGFKVFHPMVFQRVIESLHLVPEYEKSVKRQRRKKAQEPAKKVAAGKGKRKRQPVQEDSMEVDEMSQSSMTRDLSLSETEQSHIHQLTLDAVKVLCLCLKKVSFRDEEVSRQQAITVLVKMIACDMHSGAAALDVSAIVESDLRNEESLSLLGWKCLHALCQPFHGEREKLIAEVFRQLLPVVSMSADDVARTSAVTIPPALITVAQHAVEFVGYIVKQGKEHAYQPIKALLQHVCFKTPDKAEYRTKLAKLTTSLLGHVEDDSLYISMLHWLYKFSRNTKVSFRLFALDIVSQLISLPLRIANDAEKLTGDQQYFLTYHFLLRIVLSRCSDRSAVVRARALTALAAAANSMSNMEVIAVVKELVLPRHISNEDQPMETNAGDEAVTHADLMLPMIHRRASDDKVVVRKAAIQALEAIVRLDLSHIRKEDVQIFHDHCMDPALSIRKQALSSLNSLTISVPICTIMHNLWLDGVMPMVMDKETSVQEKCFSLLEEFLLSQITSHTSYPNEMEQFVWQLFNVIASDEDLQRYFKKACLYWTNQKKITTRLVNCVISHALSTDHCNSAWMILETVSTFASTLVDEVAIIGFWRQCISQQDDTSVDAGVLRRVLVVLGYVTNKMSQEQLRSLQEQLEKLLIRFDLDHVVAGAAIDTMEKIIRCQYPNHQASATKEINKWALPLIKCCENYLSSVVTEQSSDGPKWNEDSLIKHLFILGEVAQLCPFHISHHLCLMIQSMLLATANHGIGGSDSQTIQRISLPPQVIAHGYITLGKLCLQHVDLVEKSIVQMAMELEKSEHSVIRNNIIVVLCDLMVRYSSRVDMYVSKITACLKDESVLVRKQTLTLLTHLLQEDYVKWKDSLFFRFLSTLVDNELKRYAEFCLVHLVTSKHPTVFYQHFVECIFFYNSYEKHKVYNRFKESAKVKELFSLKGSLNAKKRQGLYQFMLKHMTDEQKFQLSGKLCQEVLGAIVDHILPLDDNSFPLIRDALFVLASKEIKLTSFQSDTVEELEDEGDMMGAAVAAARNKLITHIVKKNVIENIVPIVVSMKHMFEKAHSPLLKDLMLYLKELMKDYRSDVADILATDKQLAEEIEFDLRRFEEEQQKAAAKGQTPAVITPHTRVVSPLLSPAALHTPPQQGAVAITATPVATTHPMITPAAQAALAKFVTPKTKTPQKPTVQGSVGVKSVNQAVMIASAKRSAIKASLAASKVKPRLMSKLNTADLPPPKDLVDEMKNAEDETLVMPTRSVDRIASTPGGLAETISFNVSSIVPPSPIMAALMRNTELNAAQPNVVNGGHQMGKRPRSTSETSTQITMDLDKPLFNDFHQKIPNLKSRQEIKLTSFQSDTVEELEDEGDMMGAAVAAARNKLITHIVKKNVIENIVPIVVSMKHMFEKAHSPLLKDLMLYLKELMKDYRSDVADILATDKQLAEEIEFDLQRFEEEQQKAAAKGQTPAVITPHTRVVSPLLSPTELHTPPQQGAVAITATPVTTTHPMITPAAQAALTKFVTPKTKTPQKPTVQGSVGVKSVNQAVMIASAKRSAIKASLAASKVKPRLVTSKLNPADLPPPKDLADEIKNPEDETLVMPTRSVDRIASTPGGLAETISFIVSSIVPPSPIMAALMRNTELNAAQPNVVNGGHQMGKRPRSTSETSTQITMDLDKPMQPPKPWRVTFK